MAAKKKKVKSKKKSSTKAATKPVAKKKKTAVKKQVTKKKKSALKKIATKKLSTKKSNARVSVSAKVDKADNEIPQKTTPKKQKLSSGKSKKIGARVKALTGRSVGEKGVIVRQDAFLGTFFIILDRNQNNAVYKNIEWGPYFESQLEFLKSR